MGDGLSVPFIVSWLVLAIQYPWYQRFFLARGGMLWGEERKSDRNRRGKVFRTQGTTATASLCRSGGEDGVREKKSA